MRGMFNEKGELIHPYAVWSSYFNEKGEFKYQQTLETENDWLPCDAYVIFAFTKNEDGERWKGKIARAGKDITADNISYELLYDKTFINLMLAAADYYGKNDDVFAGMLKQRLGFVNVPENAKA